MTYKLEILKNTNNIDMLLKNGKTRSWKFQLLFVKYVNGDMDKAQTLITV